LNKFEKLYTIYLLMKRTSTCTACGKLGHKKSSKACSKWPGFRKQTCGFCHNKEAHHNAINCPENKSRSPPKKPVPIKPKGNVIFK